MKKYNRHSLCLPLIAGCLLLFTAGSSVFAASQMGVGYTQCLQESMQGKTGESAEREAKNHCRDQFIDEEKNRIELPVDAINQLKIDAGFGWGIFNGSIYNGNRDYFVTQLTVSMTPIHDHHMEMMGTMSHDAKEHTIDLKLPPLSKGALSLALEADDSHIHDFEWKIIKVLGHKVK